MFGLMGVARNGGQASGPVLLSVPAGFSWTPPVNIYRSAAGVYSTDFNADDWKVAASADIWISPTGNDTTGAGTQANPYRSPTKAMAVAAAGADVGYNIYCVAGEYSGFGNTVCDRDLNWIAVGGRCLMVARFPVATWTLDGTGTYKATRSGVNCVVDTAFSTVWPNCESTPENLVKVTSLATCQATASTWYTDGTYVWVHLQDGRAPDASASGSVRITVTPNAGYRHAYTRSLFMQGFDIEGASTIAIRARNITTTAPIPQVVLDDCTVRFFRGALFRGIQLDGCTVAIVNNCRVFDSEGDGIGYSQIGGADPSCNAVEIDCHAYTCGALTTHTSIQNGSTNHADGRTVRVNCTYRDCYGPVVADIGTTQNWNLGVDAQDCLLGDMTQQDASFSTYGGTAKTWLDGCTTGGAHYDLYSDTGCQILYRNMTAPASTGGAGTIGTY